MDSDINTTQMTITVVNTCCSTTEEITTIAKDVIENYTKQEDGTYLSNYGMCNDCQAFDDYVWVPLWTTKSTQTFEDYDTYYDLIQELDTELA